MREEILGWAGFLAFLLVFFAIFGGQVLVGSVAVVGVSLLAAGAILVGKWLADRT